MSDFGNWLGLLDKAFKLLKKLERESKYLIAWFMVVVAVRVILYLQPEIMEQWEKEISYLALGLLGIFSFNLLWVYIQRRRNKPKTPGNPREQLIEAVRTKVAQRLKDSLQTSDPIPLTMPDQPQAVGRGKPREIPQENSQNSQNFFFRMARKLFTFGRSPSEEDLEPQSKIIDIFQREDINGKLLILGQPGSGKTTTLLELARDLIAQANSTQPFIPVLLELTNWTDNRQSMEEWLVAELKDRHHVPPKQTQEWLEKHLLLPMLDGLDELGIERQRTCIQRINQFVENSNYRHLVVCCRSDEYEQGQVNLKALNGAVCLQPLSDGQIQEYLQQVGRPSLWAEIEHDETLKELATTPLLLGFIAAAYPQQAPHLISASESPSERRQAYLKQIFQTYIDKKLQEPLPSQWYRPGKKPSPEQTKRWLSFLARRLREERKTEFLIEKMQPIWLGNKVKRRIYFKFVGLIYGLIYGVIFGLIFGLIFEPIKGVIGGLIFGLIRGLIRGQISKIQPTETLGWSTERFKHYLNYGLFGLIGGLIYGLIDKPICGLIYGLIYGVIFGLIGGLIGGLSGPDMDIKTRDCPNQGIWNSLQNSLVFSGLSFPFTVLLFVLPRWATEKNVGLLDTFIFAISFAILLGFFAGGGRAGIKHIILRLLLHIDGDIPWNYKRFLGYADERKLVQQLGGRYRFVHDLLREHFAGEPPVRLTHTIAGHADQVRSIALSPDGRWLISGSRDQTAKLWSLSKGELQKTLANHTDEVNCVAFAADGTTVATGSDDRTVKVYRLKTAANGKVRRVSCQFTLEGHVDEVWSLAISPDNQTLASGSRDGTVKIWNLANGQLEHTLVGHSKGVFSLAFHPDGHILASGSRDRTICLWNPNIGQLQKTLPKNPVQRFIRKLPYRFTRVDDTEFRFFVYSGTIYSLHFSPDGSTLISSSAGEAIEFWDIPTGKWRKTTTVHSDCEAPVAINWDQKLLAAMGNDDCILLYDVPEMNFLGSFYEPVDNLNGIGFTGDGNYFVNACDDGSIKVRQLLPALWQTAESANNAKFLWCDRFLNVLITILTLICVLVPIALYNWVL